MSCICFCVLLSSLPHYRCNIGDARKKRYVIHGPKKKPCIRRSNIYIQSIVKTGVYYCDISIVCARPEFPYNDSAKEIQRDFRKKVL